MAIKKMRFLSIILGVLLILGGAFCIFNGSQVFDTFSWLLGLVVLLSGIGWLCVYSESRQRRQNDYWTLLGGILAVIIGLGIVLIDRISASWELFLAISLGAWALLFGVILIMLAFKIRRILHMDYYRKKGLFWFFIFLIGILSVAVGIYGGMHPYLVKEITGMLIGILMVIAGFYTLLIGLIMASILRR